LIDTSVWIDFFRGVPSRETTLLRDCIGQRDRIFVTGVIAQEILQGIRDDPLYQSIKDYLFLFDRLDVDFSDHVEAANIYRSLRKTGVTISSPIDCLIAFIAIRHNVSLLHKDSDFTLIAKHYPLLIVT